MSRAATGFIAVMALLTAGCMRDVTHDPRYGFTQYVGRTRQIKQDYFLCTGTDIADCWLAAPGSDYPVPKSIEAYERERPQSAAGYIRAGTRLRYKKLLYDEKQWNG